MTQCFTAANGDTVGRKMLPTQSTFDQPKQMEVKGRQIWTVLWVWWDCPAKTGNMLHHLQTGMRPGVTVLQEKGQLLLWPEAGSGSLQLSQCHDVAIRVDD